MRVACFFVLAAASASSMLADDLPPAPIPNLASVLKQTVKYTFSNTCSTPSSTTAMSCGNQSGVALLQLAATPRAVVDSYGDLIVDGSNPVYTNGPNVQDGIWAVTPDGTVLPVSDSTAGSCRMTSATAAIVSTVAVTSFHWNAAVGALFMTTGNYEDDYTFTKSNPTFCQTFTYSSGDYSQTEHQTLAMIQVDYPNVPTGASFSAVLAAVPVRTRGIRVNGIARPGNRRPVRVQP